MLFNRDLVTFNRIYAFLSQIFDYGNTGNLQTLHLLQAPAAPARLRPQRATIDLSRVVLTHHNLKNQGERTVPLTAAGDAPKLKPLTEAAAGAVH